MLGRLLLGLKGLFSRSSGAHMDERRDLIRLSLSLPVYCRLADANFKATLVDISVGGMRLSVSDPRAFSVGEVLTVGADTFNDVDRVACKVMWTQRVPRGCMLGVKFTDPPARLRKSWVKRSLRESGLSGALFRERRRSRRVKVKVPVEVSMADLTSAEGISDGPPLLTTVTVNLSEGGAAFRSTRRVPLGTLVVLTLGPIEALPKVRLTGRVLSIQEDFGDESLTYRVMFLDPMPEGFVRFLKKHVA